MKTNTPKDLKDLFEKMQNDVEWCRYEPYAPQWLSKIYCRNYDWYYRTLWG